MKLTPTLCTTLALLLGCGGAAFAQSKQKKPAPQKPVPKTWDSLDAAFEQDGLPIYLNIERPEREVFLIERAGTSHPLRFAPFKLSEGMMKRIESAVAKSKRARGTDIFLDSDVELDGTALREVVQIVTLTAQRRAEPEVRTLSGKMVSFDYGDVLYLNGWKQNATSERGGDDDGLEPTARGRVDITHIRPKVAKALSLVGEAEIRALVWVEDERPTLMAPLSFSVRANPKTMPKGIKPNTNVKVVGLTTVPTQTIQTPAGPRIVGGEVVKVVDEKGNKGVLVNPYQTTLPVHKPRLGATQALQQRPN